jgi:DNA repair ATPase RecN
LVPGKNRKYAACVGGMNKENKMDDKAWRKVAHAWRASAHRQNRRLWDLIGAIHGAAVEPHDTEKAIGDAMAKISTLREHVEVDEKLLSELERLLKVIPECPVHGRCIPHAIEWVKQHKQLQSPLKCENEELKKKLAEIGEIASKLLELPIFKESK